MNKFRDWLIGTAVAGVFAALGWDSFDSAEEPLRAIRSDRRSEFPAPSIDVVSTAPGRLAAISASSSTRPAVIPPTPRTVWPKPSAQGLIAWGEPSPTPPTPVPPPPPPSVVAPPPQAPAFPYELIGMLEEEGLPQAFLNGSMRVIAVQSGDVIDGQWRVDGIGVGQLSMTWLPSKLPLTVGYRAPRF